MIEVEEMRPQAKHVLELVDLHNLGQIEVALLGVSATENTKTGVFPASGGLFRDRISQLGWQDLPLVPMPAVVGLSYIGSSFVLPSEFEHEVAALWQVIAPNVAPNLHEHSPSGRRPTTEELHSPVYRKWRNSRCDVIAAYSHIRSRRDVFVTNNTKDFQRKRRVLRRLGMMHIYTPEVAINVLRRTGIVT